MKTYVLTVSRYFPKTHKRAGEETFFKEKILSAIGKYDDGIGRAIGLDKIDKKIHIIRSNYPLWKKRIEQIQDGKAILSIRSWSGRPYNSKQVEICQLDKDSGCVVQMLDLSIFKTHELCFVNSFENSFSAQTASCNSISKNDGLSLENFKEWFKCYDLSEPMAIIHFTSFRY